MPEKEGGCGIKECKHMIYILFLLLVSVRSKIVLSPKKDLFKYRTLIAQKAMNRTSHVRRISRELPSWHSYQTNHNLATANNQQGYITQVFN
jgi:hypothetical protein